MSTSSGPDPVDATPAGHSHGQPTAPPVVGAERPEVIDDWAELFAALADVNRLRLLLAIHHTPGINVTDLAAAVGMGANAASHALSALRLRGVVRSERAGRERRWSIASDEIHALLHQVGATHSPLHPEH
jgi:DNA-binding transcriptional ArsR family regulator